MLLSSSGLRKITCKLVEAAGPTFRVAVAGGLVEELLVGEGQSGAAAIGLDQDGDERLALRRGAPGPSEHELLVRHHLAIDAADVMLLAVDAAHDDAEAAADARVRLGAQGLDLFRPEPLGYFFGLRPRGVDFSGGCGETTLKGEAGLGGDGGLDGHDSSLRNAGRRSSPSDQKRS